MAFYSPLSALGSFGGGFIEGRKDADEEEARRNALQMQKWDMQGMAALSNALGMGPQAPPPGQQSMPRQPPPQPPPVGGPSAPPPMAGAPPPPSPPGAGGGGGMFAGLPGWAPGERPIEMGPAPPQGPQAPPGVAPGGGGAPPPMSAPPAGPAGGGMPQLDFQTLAQRIQEKNPGLPPQAMFAALKRAEPLLNAQGKMELAREDRAFRQAQLEETKRFHRATEANRGQGPAGTAPASDTIPEEGVGGWSKSAIEAAAERSLKTGAMPTGLTRTGQGRAIAAAIQNRAAQLAEERNIPLTELPKRQQQFKAEQIAIQRWESGPQGNVVRSLGVVTDHLETMQSLATALENGNINAFNRIAQEWAAQTGQPAPTNFDTAKRIVGAEVIKALGVAGAGTAEERKEAGDAFNRARSPEQISGAIKTVQKLLGGQLRGARRQFTASTGLSEEKFNEMLPPDALKWFEQGAKRTGDTGAASGFDREAAKKAGYSDEEIDQFLKGK